MVRIAVCFIFSGLIIPWTCFAGTAYIPIWQHGFGVTYVHSVYNSDTKSVLAELTLYDLIFLGTYTTSQSIAPGDAWIVDVPDFVPVTRPILFGWGMITSTGDPGTTFSEGAIYGTLSGKMTGLTVSTLDSGFTGRAYIPIWQHGLGVTYFNNVVNSDTKDIVVDLTLIDIRNTNTYTSKRVVTPGDAWISDTAAFDGWYQAVGGAGLGFGWGYIDSDGAPGTSFAWGAVYGTIAGRIIGLTVLVPEQGF